MPVKFRSWLLTHEKRGPKDSREILVLRDPKGRVRRTAETEEDQRLLRKWWKRYNQANNLESLLASRRLRERVRRLKQRIRKRGFTDELAFIGVRVDPRSGTHQYNRVELFGADPWTRKDVARLYVWFRTHPVRAGAGVFIYHNGALKTDPLDPFSKVVKKNRRTRPKRSGHGRK